MSTKFDSMAQQVLLSLVSIFVLFLWEIFFFSRRGPSWFIPWACPHLLWHGLLRRDRERQEDQVWGSVEPGWRHHGAPHWILNHKWCRNSVFSHKVPNLFHPIQDQDLHCASQLLKTNQSNLPHANLMQNYIFSCQFQISVFFCHLVYEDNHLARIWWLSKPISWTFIRA